MCADEKRQKNWLSSDFGTRFQKEVSLPVTPNCECQAINRCLFRSRRGEEKERKKNE